MKIKVVLIGILVLIISGCNVKYDLKYENNNFYEDLSINDYYAPENVDGIVDIKYIKNDDFYYDIQEKLLYDKDIITKKNDLYDIKLNASYEKYSDSNVLNNCFQYFDYEEDNNKIYISVYGKYKCEEFENLEIKFKSDKKVVYSNSHKVKNNIYIWEYEDDERIDVSFEIDKTIEDSYFNYWFLIKIVLIICVVLVVGYFGIKIYKRFKSVSDLG